MAVNNFIVNSPWKFNSLNIYNFTSDGPYKYIYDFIGKNHQKLEGDILEAGTYRGRMTLGLALFLKNLGSGKLVHTFDTFKGFPEYSKEDGNENFDSLYAQKKISSKHYQEVQDLRLIRRKLNDGKIQPNNISTSGNFSNTSLDRLNEKISLLELANIRIYPGEFGETMNKNVDIKKIMFAFIDCDLYGGYMQSLNFIWPRLSMNGVIFLDEYYSLKFPGARIAVDQFLDLNATGQLIDISEKYDDFERWVLIKNENR